VREKSLTFRLGHTCPEYNKHGNAAITSHSDNQWVCTGNAVPNGESAFSVVIHFAP
jgi:hypothetical protein